MKRKYLSNGVDFFFINFCCMNIRIGEQLVKGCVSDDTPVIC